MEHSWIPTIEIATNPQAFIDKNVIIGSQYSLVTNTKPFELDHSLFANHKVVSTLHKNNTIYVLVEVNSFESANQLESSLIFKRMTSLPDFYDSRTYQTVTYMVTAKMPDGSTHSFSQLLPAEFN